MADRIYFFLLATLVFEANSQSCGCGGPGPIFPGPMVPQLAPGMPCMGPMVGPPPIIAEPYIAAPPMIPNVIPASQPIFPVQQPIFPTPTVIAQPYPNVVAATIVDNTLSNSLANAIQLLIVSNLIENTLNVGMLPDNILNLCDTVIKPVVPCNEFIELIPVTPNIAPTCICETPVLEPLQPIYSPAVATMAPLAAEVMFPSAIPAQLTCNLGYMNTNVPCVSVNVEPLQNFDGCNPYFNNGYFY